MGSAVQSTLEMHNDSGLNMKKNRYTPGHATLFSRVLEARQV